MTVEEMIRRVDELKPNAFTLGQKGAWLSEMESQLWTELLLQPAGDWEGLIHAQRPLLLPEAWQRLYESYLGARIDLANSEYSKYGNAMALYNDYVQALAAWYGDRFRPADRPARWVRLGSLTYNGAGGQWVPMAALPPGCAVLALMCRVEQAFDGGNVTLSLGTASAPESWLRTVDIMPESAGVRRCMQLRLPVSGRQELYAFSAGDGDGEGRAVFLARIQPGKER